MSRATPFPSESLLPSRHRLARPTVLTPLLATALLVFATSSCRTASDPGELVSEPIVHIGANERNPRLMETAILLVIRAPFETVRSYVSDPGNIQRYIAFARESHAEPFPGGPEADQLVKVRTTVVDLFGLSIPGKDLELRWHPVTASDAVLVVAFEQVKGAYEHLSGSLYAADLFDGSTAVMLRTTTRTGFVPELVRERLARWHAHASIRKLTELLESQGSG